MQNDNPQLTLLSNVEPPGAGLLPVAPLIVSTGLAAQSPAPGLSLAPNSTAARILAVIPTESHGMQFAGIVAAWHHD